MGIVTNSLLIENDCYDKLFMSIDEFTSTNLGHKVYFLMIGLRPDVV